MKNTGINLFEFDTNKLNLLGGRLFLLRSFHKLNKTGFAKKIGVSFASYWTYEDGRTVPTIDVLKKIADSFDCDLHWLITGELAGYRIKLSEYFVSIKNMHQKPSVPTVNSVANKGSLNGH